MKIDPKDIIGKKINKITVVEFDHYNNKSRIYFYKCKCDCGKYFITTRYKLVNNKISSCGHCIRLLENKDDIVGKRYGKLIVLSYDHEKPTGNGHIYFYRCKCDCGNIIVTKRNALLNGNTRSCGCISKIHDLNDIVGRKFGELTVLSYDHKGNNALHLYKCKCSCGKETIVARHNLLKGKSKSCGCKMLENIREINATHHMSRTKFYNTWNRLRDRCNNPNNSSYNLYGGRGIKVCERWDKSFENFKEDMYDSFLEHIAKYGPENTSIDRIDPNGDYCPENCRWTTNKVQCNNRRSNHYIYYNNEKISLSDLIDKYADPRISYTTILHRLNLGWDIEKAISKIPNYINGKPVTCPVIFHDEEKKDDK